jgi:hypothetical protein
VPLQDHNQAQLAPRARPAAASEGPFDGSFISHKAPRPAEGLFLPAGRGFATTQTEYVMTESRVAKRGL